MRLVDADAFDARVRIAGGMSEEELTDDFKEGVLAVLELLKTQPTAQPETAKRIVGKSRGGMTLWYQCNICNEPVDAHDNFCRGCGRRLTDG